MLIAQARRPIGTDGATRVKVANENPHAARRNAPPWSKGFAVGQRSKPQAFAVRRASLAAFAVVVGGCDQFGVGQDVAALAADTGGKYYMERKRLDDATDRRRYRHRGPTLRSLVKLAVACDSAEQLGQQLKRRYDRQRQRAGLAQSDRRRAEAELDAQLDRLLVD
ncbi:hypothetical protein ACFIOY_40165 [Bradyrhizobium sp. TZ2]